jgi:hypothetical protein
MFYPDGRSDEALTGSARRSSSFALGPLRRSSSGTFASRVGSRKAPANARHLALQVAQLTDPGGALTGAEGSSGGPGRAPLFLTIEISGLVGGRVLLPTSYRTEVDLLSIERALGGGLFRVHRHSAHRVRDLRHLDRRGLTSCDLHSTIGPAMLKGHDVTAPVLGASPVWASRANSGPMRGVALGTPPSGPFTRIGRRGWTVKGFPPLPLEGGEIRAGVGRAPVQEFFILARARYPLLSRKYM